MMGTLFHLNEIIQFAIEKENESERLYRKLADKTADPAVKKIFEKLATDEVGHKKFYEAMLKPIIIESPTSGDKSEYDAYMRELIAESRSTEPMAAIDFADLDQVIRYAIDREKDSVLFYTGLKNYVPNKDQAGINEIIKEEAKHVAILAGLLPRADE